MDAGLLPRRESDTLDTYYLRSRKVFRGHFDEFQDIAEDFDGESNYSPNHDQGGSYPGADEATSVYLLEDGDAEAKTTQTHQPSGSQPYAVAKLYLCVFIGIVYGFVIDKSRITRPHSIRNQCMFRQWAYAKVILTSLAVAQLLMCILALLPVTRDLVYSAMRTFSLWLRGHGPLAIVVGSLMMGTGMTMSGTCPTTLFVQLGSLTANSVYTAIGALFGALVFGLLHSQISERMRPRSYMKRQTVFGKLGWRYPVVGLPAGVIVTVVLYILYIRVPWYRDIHPEDRNRLFGVNTLPLSLKSWPPYVAGVVMGIVQVLLVYLVGDGLDSSRAVQTLSAQWIRSDKHQEKYSYLAQLRSGLDRWWPVFLSVGMLLGGTCSSLMAGTFGKTTGVPVMQALVGGFFMMLGARIAGGGTSRHLVCGSSMLFVLSLLAIPSLICGAFCTAKIMHMFGVLNYYSNW